MKKQNVLRCLRAQQERENPKPLTPDELREMDGEPVWVDCKDSGMWMLVEANCQYDVVWFTNNFGFRTQIKDEDDLLIEGMTVYRHKPEEGTT